MPKRRLATAVRRRPAARIAVALAVVVCVSAAGVWLAGRRSAPLPDASADPVAFLSSAPGLAGFARVTAPRPVSFPADEGPHPDYRTEWWYYTGNVASGDGRRFGFQLTFFRNAAAPVAAAAARASAWATNQVYLAHFALTDVAGGRFHSSERLARGAVGLAGARASPLRVWVEPWAAEGLDEGPGAVRLTAEDDGVGIDLVARPAKPAVLHGREGFSPKGPQPGNASMYYSFTRLEAAGHVTTSDGRLPVTGLAWMDHEWSTSALDAETQTGWDWFSLQLDDGSELMLFQIRRRDGGTAPESSGSLVDRGGGVIHLEREDFRIDPHGRWRSPRTGAEYPGTWRITVPGHELDLTVEPLLADQELSTFIRYWEGAVRVAGSVQGRPVDGFGYVEMTGYAGEGALPGGL